MSAPHTPGRLTAMPRGRIVGGPFVKYVNGEAQEQVACVMGLQSNADPGASQDADARRLAACWNACEGISTEVLETAGTRHDWCDLMQELEKERDALAAQLRTLQEACRALLDSELGKIACTGSDAPTEHDLGVIRDLVSGS